MAIKSFLLAAFGLLFVLANAQENYRKIFSSDYQQAVQFIKDEEKWMNEIIKSHGLDSREVKAIVFPELIRYSSIRDKAETFALESLYIQNGKAYADFSIGRFQIKPSFAENVEVDFIKAFGAQELSSHLKIPASDTTQTVNSRSARLRRIKDKEIQLTYVCLFFKLMQQKYPVWKSEEEKIKFLASAYNSNYRKPAREIRSFMSKKFFHVGFVASTKYNYSDIAWYSFQNEFKKD